MKVRRTAVAVTMVLAVGCSCSSGHDAEASPPTTGRDPATTSTTRRDQASPPEGRPTEPLEPSTPAWTKACTAGDDLIEQAWDLHDGTLQDPMVLAGSIIRMMDEAPPGADDASIAWVRRLIGALGRGEDLSRFHAGFRSHAEALLDTAARGCSVRSGAALPIPAGVIESIEGFLFGPTQGG